MQSVEEEARSMMMMADDRNRLAKYVKKVKQKRFLAKHRHCKPMKGSCVGCGHSYSHGKESLCCQCFEKLPVAVNFQSKRKKRK